MIRLFMFTVTLLIPLVVSAQIYRCDTPEGPVFSDEMCGTEARLVELEEDSQGLGGGPSEEVREYLDQKRQERAEERESARQVPPLQPAPATPSQPVENVALLPGYLRPVRPGRPIAKPRPRPLPEKPPSPGSGADSGGSSSTIRPRGDDGTR